MNDEEYINKIRSLNVRFKSKESLPLGNKDRGRFIPPEKGRAGILVPSYGVLEKEEIDYIIEAEQEKEDDEGNDYQVHVTL